MSMLNARKLLALVLAVSVLPTTLWAITGKIKKNGSGATVVETWPRDGIQGHVVLSMENGNGDTLRVNAVGQRATLPNILANDIDYITVVGSQTQVTVYEQPNFRGHSLTLRCGSYELLQQPRNDIESIRVTYVADDRRCQGSPEQPVQYRTWTR
jgi:hypothetical protein